MQTDLTTEERSQSIRAMDNLRRIVRAISASARSVSARGLSGAQLFVLRQVAAAPSLSLRELADRTLTGQSTVSEVVTRLVDRGLVSRIMSTTDARRAELTLTADGRQAIDDTAPTAQERLAEALAAMPTDRRVALVEALDDWVGAAGLADTPAGMFFDGKSDPGVMAQGGEIGSRAERAR